MDRKFLSLAQLNITYQMIFDYKTKVTLYFFNGTKSIKQMTKVYPEGVYLFSAVLVDTKVEFRVERTK
jgi:hypothetical protein